MESMQRATFHASDFTRYGTDYTNTAYLPNPKAMTASGKSGQSSTQKNGKMMNRRLKSGHSNNRANLSVYTNSQKFVDPIYNAKKRKNFGGRGQSLKQPKREQERNKPMTAQQEKRMTSLNEQGSSGSIKDSIVATIKQSLVEEEAKGGQDNSFTSDRPTYKAALPAVDHETSKRKIEGLMFNPSDHIGIDSTKSRRTEGLSHIDKNGPETNLNDMPDLTTFDNRDSSNFNQLINQKMKGTKKDALPNKSMRNLKQKEEDVLPIYKRRAYNRGPVKLKDSNIGARKLQTNYTSKPQDAWVKDTFSTSADENTNAMNHNGPIKGRPIRSGRQPSEFRINKTRTNPKSRGKTANGPRESLKDPIAAITDLKSQNPISKPNSGPKKSQNNPKKPQNSDPTKRAQSQHHSRLKGPTINPTESTTDIFSEIEKLKEQMRSNTLMEETPSQAPNEESKDFLDTEFTFEKDMEQMIKIAEAKIKATADAMAEVKKADKGLEDKINELKLRSKGQYKPTEEALRLQNHLKDERVYEYVKQESQGQTRHEKVANMVNQLIAQDDDGEDDDSQEDNEKIHDPNTLISFNSKVLEPIKEQFTEEIQWVATEENQAVFETGPNAEFDVEKIFDSNYKQSTKLSKFKKDGIQDTPMFGEKYNSDSTNNLFSSFLWHNEVSTQKKQKDSYPVKENEHKLIQDVSKNILKEFDNQYDVTKVIVIQSKLRQWLAKRRAETLRKRSYISHQQKALASNKQKVEALRIITKYYTLYREAKIAAKEWLYLVENSKGGVEEPYHIFCDTLKDLKFMEALFRRNLFRKVRVYLKTIPYECRQSYVKLIDCKIYQREVNNKLKLMQMMQKKKRKQLNY